MDETDCNVAFDRGGDVLGVVSAASVAETGPWGMAVVGVAVDMGVEQVGNWACDGLAAGDSGTTSGSSDMSSPSGSD